MRHVLVIGHVSSCAAGLDAARSHPGLDAAEEIHVMPYGRSSQDSPSLPGTLKVELPSRRPTRIGTLRSAAVFLLKLRRRCYETVLISQPSLDHSRARGLLMFFPFVIGAKRVLAVDAEQRQVVGEVSAGRALIDFTSFLFMHALATVMAEVAVVVVRLAPARRPSLECQRNLDGTVLYLRTDIDLAGRELTSGGSLAHTDGIVRAILRRGHVLTYCSTGKIAGLPQSVVHNPLPVVQPANTPIEISELISGLRQAVHAGRRAQSTGFVYQRYSLNNLAGLLLARQWKVPLVLEANSSEANWRRDWSSLTFPRLAFACERLLLRSADVVCTVSENAARELEENGAEHARLVVAPNGVEVERFADADPRSLPFEHDTVVIAFVGLFYPWHGVRHLAEAFVRLVARYPHARLLLLGDGEQRALVQKVLRDGGVLGVTHMPGSVPREEVAGYLAAADILVSPHADVKRFPGSPIKIFEYMASGRAIVASDLAQIGAVLRHEETALLTPPGDEEALARAIERLLVEPDLRRRLGAAAQEEARASHSWDERLDRILGALE